MKIIDLQKVHFPAVSRIYSEGMESGIATFETKVPSWEQFDQKFLKKCRYVLVHQDEIAAWCGLSAVSKREVYKGVAEDTIYVAKNFQGKGFGKIILKHLISESEKNGFWTLQAGIFPQNKASIRLHENCGFRIIGKREKIAQRDGVWYDNILMERRSEIVSHNIKENQI